MNFFELFGFSVNFDIDSTQLSERYRELQRTVHPDKFSSGSEQEKLLAVQKTAQINDAYQSLKDPIQRAEHILKLRGIDISHETMTVKDTAFLMQQMDWREELEDLRGQAEPHLAIEQLQASFELHRSQIMSFLMTLLLSESEKDLLAAADQIRKLKFMTKLQDELLRIEDSLFDL
ncbi:co-chaperone HscB [Parashewanella spongiae]|uniref:Co-chaperone protein HscB homolog n=1 Tax=Parashewanella spongiae TaxID=342950 RepID=A0A3A6U367_9GAMM|nr:co-chaperone HscB [Parashewanella spongiae]MCL1079420.1 co-chaperone HscB [Parashewanella spongiae]RJY07678.1 co-chaperone HscB [Parashewanella spongiae]